MIGRRALVLSSLWLAVSAAAFALPACYGRTCEGSTVSFGAGPGEGRLINADTWESSPARGKWLFFPGARTYFFDAPPLGERIPDIILPYISPSEDPTRSSFTLASGNLAVLSSLDTHRVAINNSSCSDYYLRVVLVASPYPPGTPGTPGAPDPADDPDGGVDDGGADDGGDDGGT